jgi:polyphosphate kinase
VKALIEASERGKQVAVLVELKARFDEENNILWTRRLEEAGAHVIYGIVGLKTHAKMTLVIRQEGNVLRRYVHLGTGNYNTMTARIYTDLCLFTAEPEFGADASELFNVLTGFSGQTEYRKLMVAPIGLREHLTRLIKREAENKAAGRPAGIVIKCNSLTDTEIIEELYAASAAGVPITLIVRGVCCLRPGVPGLSENIRVAGTLGRFLEHSRVYLFTNRGENEIYIGSADVMHRNLDRRVEVVFPIDNAKHQNRVVSELIELAISDNTKLRWLQPDGSYRAPSPNGDSPINLQEELMARHGALK